MRYRSPLSHPAATPNHIVKRHSALHSPTRSSDLTNNFNRQIFEERYFSINRRLLICLGLWPYETRTKNAVRTLVIATMTLLSVPQLLSVIVHYQNTDRLMLSMLMFLTVWVMNLKVIAMNLAEDNMKELHRSIVSNWRVIQDQKERDILHRYSEWGRKITSFYVTYMVGSAITGAVVPLIPKILDEIFPLENPRTNVYFTEGEYLVDREMNFVLLYFVDNMVIAMLCLITITVDSMYMVSVEHCCALYAIVRYRLLKLRRMVLDNSSTTEDGDSYEWLVRTIKLHQNTLTFTSTLNDSFSKNFLFILILTLVVIPLVACMVIAKLDHPLNLCPYAAYFLAIMVHLFAIFCPGQRILDHGHRLCDAAYCNEWYAIPLRTRKLLQIFMLRCSQPASITAGGLLLINLEICSGIIKMCVSYITVASSFR